MDIKKICSIYFSEKFKCSKKDGAISTIMLHWYSEFLSHDYHFGLGAIAMVKGEGATNR